MKVFAAMMRKPTAWTLGLVLTTSALHGQTEPLPATEPGLAFEQPEEVAPAVERVDEISNAEPVAPVPSQAITDAPAKTQTVSEDQVIAKLLADYVDAAGGERNIRKTKSLVIKGTMEINRENVDYEIHRLPEGRFYTIHRFPRGTTQTGFNGTNYWTQTGKEGWLAMEDTNQIQQAAFEGDLLQDLKWKEVLVKPTLKPDVDLNGRNTRVIAADLVFGGSVTLYFDQQTRRIVKSEVTGENAEYGVVTVETYFKDFREVNGLVLPFLKEVHFSNLPGKVLISRVRSAEVNGPVDLTLLNPPKSGSGTAASVRETERFLPSLTVGGITYTNVWVHRQTNNNILIRHALGIQTIRLTDLPKGDLNELRPQLGSLANMEEQRSVVTEKWSELAGNKEIQEKAQESLVQAKEVFAYIMVPVLIAGFVVFLIFSYMLSRLCQRTGTKGGIGVWLPVVQIAPFFRSAGIPEGWVGAGFFLIFSSVLAVAVSVATGKTVEPGSLAALGMILPIVLGLLLFLVLSFIWPFKICGRCKKSPVLGLLMFVPLVNLGFFAYLAFSED